MALPHILFPVDFSEHCTAAADYIEAMARGSEARLTLLHVLEYPPSWYSDIEAARLSSIVDFAQVKKHRQEQLNLYLEPKFRDLAPLRLLWQGDPAYEIVQFAAREGVSLIMMPTRGRGVFRRLLLGSVAAKVLHDVPCPVWTSSHTEHVTPARYPCRNVACAVDLSERSVETLGWASQFASEQNADMHVVHALDVDEESTNRGVREVRRYLHRDALERWKGLEKQLSLKAPLCIAYGSVAAAVRKAAHDLEADVLIIGRGIFKNRSDDFVPTPTRSSESLLARLSASDEMRQKQNVRASTMQAMREVKEAATVLFQEELDAIDAYWRAANYLSVGQIYLRDNPLLSEPLRKEHIKPRLLGHWGTTPGLNFSYVHCNRVIRKYGVNMIFIAGPGHGGWEQDTKEVPLVRKVKDPLTLRRTFLFV